MVEDGRIRTDRIPLFQAFLREGGKVRVVQSPDDIKIVVAGGVTGNTLMFSYGGPNRAHQTKMIRA